jgi:hypothetical protein
LRRRERRGHDESARGVAHGASGRPDHYEATAHDHQHDAVVDHDHDTAPDHDKHHDNVHPDRI